LFILPRANGGGGPSAARSAKDGGRGARDDEVSCDQMIPRARRPLHHALLAMLASRGPPPPLSRGRMQYIPVLALRFLFAPRVLPNPHRTKAPPKSMIPKSVHGFRIRSCSQKGRRSADWRTPETVPRIRALPLCGFTARAAFDRRARLSALYRGSDRLLGSVRSRASWSRTTDPRPGQPAPGGPASWPAGRVSEPPAEVVTSLLPGTAPARINRPSPVDVPQDERDALF
jgi:hypothetical protein